MWGEDRTICSVASMPLSRGMCRSISTTSGCSSSAVRTASAPLSAAPDHLGRVVAREQRLEAVPELVVVVDHHDPQLFHHDLALSSVDQSVSGRIAWTRVPRRGFEVTVHVPPSSSARSCMDSSPTPPSGRCRARCRRRGPPPRGRRADGAASTVHRRGRAVPERVVDRLQDDPVRRHLDRGRQRLDVVVGLDGPAHRRVAGAIAGGPVVVGRRAGAAPRPAPAGRGPEGAARRPAGGSRRCRSGSARRAARRAPPRPQGRRR